MRFGSKRWRRARLFRIRKLRRKDLAWVKQWPDLVNSVKRPFRDKDCDRYNRAVHRLNRKFRKPIGGYPECDGLVECPVCGKELPTFGDPDCWTRNDNPARLGRSWDVTGYWPGMAQCCGLLIAPEFEQRCIVVDERSYRNAKARRARVLKKEREQILTKLQTTNTP